MSLALPNNAPQRSATPLILLTSAWLSRPVMYVIALTVPVNRLINVLLEANAINNNEAVHSPFYHRLNRHGLHVTLQYISEKNKRNVRLVIYCQ